MKLQNVLFNSRGKAISKHIEQTEKQKNDYLGKIRSFSIYYLLLVFTTMQYTYLGTKGTGHGDKRHALKQHCFSYNKLYMCRLNILHWAFLCRKN